jgi:hypothetical protein
MTFSAAKRKPADGIHRPAFYFLIQAINQAKKVTHPPKSFARAMI